MKQPRTAANARTYLTQIIGLDVNCSLTTVKTRE